MVMESSPAPSLPQSVSMLVFRFQALSKLCLVRKCRLDLPQSIGGMEPGTFCPVFIILLHKEKGPS